MTALILNGSLAIQEVYVFTNSFGKCLNLNFDFPCISCIIRSDFKIGPKLRIVKGRMCRYHLKLGFIFHGIPY